MSAIDTIFDEDIVLDEAAFDTAIAGFTELSGQLLKLRNNIDSMLNTLKSGFDTPAGVKFINACNESLSVPLEAQEKVIKHISTTLRESKQAYKSVFREYEALQSTINQAGK